MTFSDEDLKQLKECIAGDHPHAIGECLNLDADDYAKKVEALLARLEAAEESIAHSHGPASNWCCEKAKELDRSWRKAAEK